MQTKTIAFVLQSKQSPDDSYYGWGNGYVAVPEGHVYYGMEADEVPFGGGFVNYAHKHIAGDYAGMWVFGFDTLCTNAQELYPTEASVMAEAVKLKAEIDDVQMAIAHLEDDIRFHQQRIAWRMEEIDQLKAGK